MQPGLYSEQMIRWQVTETIFVILLNMPARNNSEFEMFSFFENSPDLVCIAGKDGAFRKVNLAVIDKLGYTEEELFARPIASFIYPEDMDMTSRERAKLLDGTTLHNFQNRYVTKGGNIIWLEWTSIYFPDKKIVLGIAKDITERKHLEKEIEEKYKKFKSLATHFKSRIEENRKYLALELHEELAQLAAVVKLDIDWVSVNEPGLAASSKSRIDHALAVSNLLINTIRRISFSLSPDMLEKLGLNAALKWHCKEFSILNGIPCVFKSAYKKENLTHEIKLDFFRICQESLINIMYHAQAGKVMVGIKDAGGKISLTIIDDGKGFDIKQQKQSAGLLSMQERAASINGQLIIQSEIGKGTKVCLTIAKE